MSGIPYTLSIEMLYSDAKVETNSFGIGKYASKCKTSKLRRAVDICNTSKNRLGKHLVRTPLPLTKLQRTENQPASIITGFRPNLTNQV